MLPTTAIRRMLIGLAFRTPAYRPPTAMLRYFDAISTITTTKGVHLNLNLALTPLISLLAGILILIMPKLLNFIVAIYLIIIGLVGLFGGGALRL